MAGLSRDVYTKRFPELESLVVQPLEYLMTAKELGNQIENVKNNETLQQFLTQVSLFISRFLYDLDTLSERKYSCPDLL
jgi:RNA processing factor Prp31